MVAWVMGIKVLILSFGVQAVASYVPSHPNWLQIWDNWDASHYLRLAENGYVAAGDARVSLVFFPLYPWLVRLVAFVVQNYIAAALIVSGFASAATAVLLRRLACCDETEQVARNAVWFLLIFPTSFFLHVPYTESLFLALCLGCFLAARKSHWALAGVARCVRLSHPCKWPHARARAGRRSGSAILADAPDQLPLALAGSRAGGLSRLSLAKS